MPVGGGGSQYQQLLGPHWAEWQGFADGAEQLMACYQQAQMQNQALLAAQAQQMHVRLSAPPLNQPYTVMPETLNLDAGGINALEERIDVPYDDWKDWQRFRSSPWWKRIFMRPK